VRPILFVDVDGVISLFGFPHDGPLPGRFHQVEGIAHCIGHHAGERLTRLAERYELVWATGWEERANEHLPHLMSLRLPEMPTLTFGGQARWGTAHWKLDALDEYAGDRPLAWIDDNIDETCRAWAGQRAAPTLLVPTESDRGLEVTHVDALIEWVESGFEPS
jgi:hypothetical protein